MISRQRLTELLNYDPETGVFTHKTTRGSRAYPGSVAGRINSWGYRQIGVDGRYHMAHRLAWLYMYDEWPDKQIDHINGDPDDNRLANLRLVTQKQNMENQKLHANNSSGHRGVAWNKSNGKWVAYVNHFGKRLYLGTFSEISDAASTVKRVRDQLFTHNKTEHSA